jgi:hypothetical protein
MGTGGENDPIAGIRRGDDRGKILIGSEPEAVNPQSKATSPTRADSRSFI